jgi:hypothetical protein
MKKLFPTPFYTVLIIACTLMLSGCLKDSYERSFTYTYFKPVYKTTDEVRANIRSNPSQPIEKPGKIYVIGSYIFLNELDKGVHVIDNADPANPKNIAFIDIPGNMDLAVKGNTLYADLYTDLVAIDISNPSSVSLQKVVENVFPARRYSGYFTADSTMVITRWEKRDTTIVQKSELDQWLRNGTVFMSYAASTDKAGPSVSVSPVGTGGSMARFTVVNERLYTVGESDLNVFNISNPVRPALVTTKNIGWNIETIYPFLNKLFIGSSTGMFVYNISNPDQPAQAGQFNHVSSCDPVIADGKNAFVTLRSGTKCQGFTNELEVLSLNFMMDPSLVKVYPLTNPFGLSKDGDLLFICDGRDGLKLYNASNVTDLKLINTITGIDTYDVITGNGKALVVAKDGLYQYDYSSLPSIRLLSKINIFNKQ